MITLGTIISKSTKDNMWWVNIPILHGVPDNKSEKDFFENYRLYQQALKLQDDEGKDKSAFKRTLYSLSKSIAVTAPREPTEDEKQFVTEAYVCSLPGANISFNVNDKVVVGFLDNSVANPIILGSYLINNPSNMLSNTALTLASLNVDCMSGVASAALPENTKFLNKDNSKIIDLSDILSAITFINQLQANGFGLDGFTKLITILNTLSQLVPGIDPFTVIVDKKDKSD